MNHRPYKPRRAGKRWLEEAPEYILDVFDNKGKTADRYTVLFGGSMFDPRMLQDRKVLFMGMNDNTYYWGECDASWRPSRERIRWLDLPEHIRNHVIRRATYDPQ